jgi:hypothetical protein
VAKINQPSNLIDRLIRLEREVETLRKRTGLGNAQISSGDLTIKGGTIRVHDEDDNQIAQIGAHLDGDGNPVTGLVVRRPNETVSLWAYGDADSNGYLSVWDEAGHIVMSTDDVSGEGLARPYIPYNVTPSKYYLTAAAGESVSGASFLSLWTLQGLKQHPRITVDVQVYTEATATGEVRLRDGITGTVLAGPVATVTNSNVNITLTATLSQAHMDWVKLEVDARCVTGAGKVWTAINYVYGIQS